MRSNFQSITLIFGFFLLWSKLFAAPIAEAVDFLAAPDTVVPRIFIKGENEKLEFLLNQQFPKQFLYVFHDNTQNAFATWARMLWEMEKFSDQIGFDIRGIKAYATFYFDKKGNIRHIAYSLKGTSRYFPPAELEKFFLKFMAHYRMPLPFSTRYNFQHEFLLVLPYPRLIEKTPAPEGTVQPSKN